MASAGQPSQGLDHRLARCAQSPRNGCRPKPKLTKMKRFRGDTLIPWGSRSVRENSGKRKFGFSSNSLRSGPHQIPTDQLALALDDGISLASLLNRPSNSRHPLAQTPLQPVTKLGPGAKRRTALVFLHRLFTGIHAKYY